MGKITAIEPQKRNPQRVNIYLDGEFAFALSRLVAAWLRVGEELSTEKIASLQAADERERALQDALRLISYRARSEKELRQRLEQKGWDQTVIQETLDRLRQNGLLDDIQFARDWIENRQTFRPRGIRLLYQELRQKGLDEQTIQQALTGVDEEAAAQALARRQAQRLKSVPPHVFHQKLIAYLIRRGFSYELANNVSQNIWEELKNEKE